MKATHGVRLHVEGYGPGRTQYTWGRVMPLAAVQASPGPEGYLAVYRAHRGWRIAETDDAVCPPQMHGMAIGSDGGTLILADEPEELRA